MPSKMARFYTLMLVNIFLLSEVYADFSTVTYQKITKQLIFLFYFKGKLKPIFLD